MAGNGPLFLKKTLKQFEITKKERRDNSTTTERKIFEFERERFIKKSGCFLFCWLYNGVEGWTGDWNLLSKQKIKWVGASNGSWEESKNKLGKFSRIRSASPKQTVWPDFAKFRLFGKSLQGFGNFFTVFYFLPKCWAYFGKSVTLLG